SLAVPNTLHRGMNVNKDFAVAAVNAVGRIDAAGGKDVYSVVGRRGDLLNLEVMSTSLSRFGVHVIDSYLRVYDAAGHLIAENDDQAEKFDSDVVDLLLPADGTYYVEVSSAVAPTAQDPVPAGSTGNYELFIYRF